MRNTAHNSINEIFLLQYTVKKITLKLCINLNMYIVTYIHTYTYIKYTVQYIFRRFLRPACNNYKSHIFFYVYLFITYKTLQRGLANCRKSVLKIWI
jgi:hypothetical protein